MIFIFEYEAAGLDYVCEWETEVTERQYELLVKGIKNGKELRQIKGLENLIRSVTEAIHKEEGHTVTALHIGEVMYDEIFLDDEIELE